MLVKLNLVWGGQKVPAQSFAESGSRYISGIIFSFLGSAEQKVIKINNIYTGNPFFVYSLRTNSFIDSKSLRLPWRRISEI